MKVVHIFCQVNLKLQNWYTKSCPSFEMQQPNIAFVIIDASVVLDRPRVQSVHDKRLVCTFTRLQA